MSLNVSANGPTSTFDRKPSVGEPPSIQAFSDGVEKPHPNVLSRNGHRKIHPIPSRSSAMTAAAKPESGEPGGPLAWAGDEATSGRSMTSMSGDAVAASAGSSE